LSADELERHFAEKGLGVPLDAKMTVRHQCNLVAKNTNSFLGSLAKALPGG